MPLDPVSQAAIAKAASTFVTAVLTRWRLNHHAKALAQAYVDAADALVQWAENTLKYAVLSDEWIAIVSVPQSDIIGRVFLELDGLSTNETYTAIKNWPMTACELPIVLNRFSDELRIRIAKVLEPDHAVLSLLTDLRIGELEAKLEQMVDEIYEQLSDVHRNDGASRQHPRARLSWDLRPASIGDEFVGRQIDIGKIKKGFERHRTVILHGGPGTGKSRLAVEFTAIDRVSGIWINGRATVDQTLASIATLFEVDQIDRTDGDLASIVIRLIADLPKESVIVIDNVPSMIIAAELLNRLQYPKLLLITRDSQARNLGRSLKNIDLIHVEPLSVEEGVQLLSLKSGIPKTAPELSEIVGLLGALPLAIESVAYDLIDGLNSVQNLLRNLAEEKEPLKLEQFQTVVGFSLPRMDSVYNALTSNINALHATTRSIIAPLGYLADLPASRNLVQALLGVTDKELISVFRECSGRSILKWDPNSQSILVHSLTTAAVRLSLGNDEALQETAFRFSNRIWQLHQSGMTSLREEIPHADHMLNILQSTLTNTNLIRLHFESSLATAYSILGRYFDSVRLAENVYGIRRTILGEEHVDTLTAATNLGVVYRLIGRIAESIVLDEVTLKLKIKLLGNSDTSVLNTMNNLAGSYLEVGRGTDAAALVRQVLKIRERTIGKEHHDTLGTMTNLVNIYSIIGRATDAIVLGTDTLGVIERILGSEHPMALHCRAAVALAYHKNHMFDEAIALGMKNLEVCRRAFGNVHPSTLVQASNLANSYRMLGKLTEAINLDEYTMEERRRVLGDEHPQTGMSQFNLGMNYVRVGRIAEGVQLEEKAVALLERVLGINHPNLKIARTELANSYRVMGRFDDAESLERHNEP